MSGLHALDADEARWLSALLRSRPKRKTDPVFRMPEDIHDALAAKGLVHWTHGRVEITLEGIREASQQPHDASGRTENADGR